MPAFKQGDVIKVPFPYTDRPSRQSRPALVISTGELEKQHGLLWIAMITSAGNRAWREDVPVSDLKMAGLPFPSVIRPTKIATIEESDASKIGSISSARLKRVKEWITTELGCS